MLNGIHGHQDIERVVYGRPAGAAVRAEAERLGAKRVFVTTTKSVAQSALLADVIKELGDRYAGVYAGITAHSPRPCVDRGCAKGARGEGRPDRHGRRRLGDRRHQGDADRAVAERERDRGPRCLPRRPAEGGRGAAVGGDQAAGRCDPHDRRADHAVGRRVQRLCRHQRSAPRHQGELRPSPDRAAGDRARSGGDARHADGPDAVDRPQGGRSRGRAAVLAAGQSVCARHLDRGAEAADRGAAGAQGAARRQGGAA